MSKKDRKWDFKPTEGDPLEFDDYDFEEKFNSFLDEGVELTEEEADFSSSLGSYDFAKEDSPYLFAPNTKFFENGLYALRDKRGEIKYIARALRSFEVEFVIKGETIIEPSEDAPFSAEPHHGEVKRELPKGWDFPPIDAQELEIESKLFEAVFSVDGDSVTFDTFQRDGEMVMNYTTIQAGQGTKYDFELFTAYHMVELGMAKHVVEGSVPS